ADRFKTPRSPTAATRIQASACSPCLPCWWTRCARRVASGTESLAREPRPVRQFMGHLYDGCLAWSPDSSGEREWLRVDASRCPSRHGLRGLHLLACDPLMECLGRGHVLEDDAQGRTGRSTAGGIDHLVVQKGEVLGSERGEWFDGAEH